MGKATSKLMQKYGQRAKKAFASYKDAPPVTPNRQLPAGIEGGIAKVVGAKVGISENENYKGEAYITITGMVVAPREWKGTPIKGAQFTWVEMLCDTPKAAKIKKFEQHFERVINQFHLLGLDTSDKDPVELDLDELCAELVESEPYFHFETWKGNPTPQMPNPRTNVNWLGVEGLEEYQEEDVGDEVEEEEETEEEEKPMKNGKKPAAKKEEPKKETPKKGKASKSKPVEEPEDEEEEEEEEDEELEDEETEEEKELEVGDRVNAKIKGKTIQVEVVTVGDENAVVKDDDGKKYRVKLEVLSPA